MSVDRTLIIKGPAKIVHDSATIFSIDDIRVRWITEYFDVQSSAFGRLKRRVKTRRIEVDVTPFSWADLTKLLPYATKQIGDTLFGATDKALVITPRNGAPLTLANAMVTQLPGIVLSVDKPILRPMKFTGLCANNTDPSVEANWFALAASAADVALTGLGAIPPNCLYSMAYKSVTERSEEGFAIDINLGLTPDVVDGDGIVNYRVKELEASLKFKPSPKTEAAYATLLGWSGKGIGADPTAGDAVITGTGSGNPIVTIANMVPAEGGTLYGEGNRLEQVELLSVRTTASNLLTALWTIGAVI